MQIATVHDMCVRFYAIAPSEYGFREVRCVHVNPDFQRKGIGGELMKDLERQLTDTTLLHLFDDGKQPGSGSFWSKHGYTMYSSSVRLQHARYYKLISRDIPEIKADYTVEVADAERVIFPHGWSTQAALNANGDLLFRRAYIALYNKLGILTSLSHITMHVRKNDDGSSEAYTVPDYVYERVDSTYCTTGSQREPGRLGDWLWVFRCSGIERYHKVAKEERSEDKPVGKKRKKDVNSVSHS